MSEIICVISLVPNKVGSKTMHDSSNVKKCVSDSVCSFEFVF